MKTTTILVAAGVAVGALLLLRRKPEVVYDMPPLYVGPGASNLLTWYYSNPLFDEPR
jgi:hypothetical protein